jgi:hypothetical protein
MVPVQISRQAMGDRSVGDARAAEVEYARILAERAEWLSTLPEMLESPYPLTAPNAAIPLYRGPLRVDTRTGGLVINGMIEITWEPTPRLRYASTDDMPLELAQLVLEGGGAECYPADLTVLPTIPIGDWEPIDNPSLAGPLTHLELGSGHEFACVRFNVPNFMDYMGAWIRHRGTPAHGRVEMTGCGWRVVIDKRPDIDNTLDLLNRRGGYAVTHIGQLERTDRSTFNREEARELIDGLYWFLSFVSGSSCGPLLPVGFDPTGVATWALWGVTTTARWPHPTGWADEHRPAEFARLFPGFMGRWLDPYWRRVVYIGVGSLLGRKRSPDHRPCDCSGANRPGAAGPRDSG